MNISELKQNVDKRLSVLIMHQAWGKSENYSKCKKAVKMGTG